MRVVWSSGEAFVFLWGMWCSFFLFVFFGFFFLFLRGFSGGRWVVKKNLNGVRALFNEKLIGFVN